MTTKIVVTGLEETLKQLGLFDELKSGKLGTVFSGGAYGPRGKRYEHYVQGAGNQAAIHQGRWRTDDDIALASASKVAAEYQKFVEAIARGQRVSLANATERALKIMYDAFIKYPPPPPNSRYIRTGTLGASYRYEVQV